MKNKNLPPADEITDPAQIKVQYEQRSALYASQFVLNAAEDDLVLDCSSGIVIESPGGSPCMPVHTRLAMSWGSAARLASLLNQALKHRNQSGAVAPGAAAGPPDKFATLPTIDNANA